MTFLILTESGLQDLKDHPGRFDAPLYINPGILDPREIEVFRKEGMDLQELPYHVMPDSAEGIEAAVKEIQQLEASSVWVERPRVSVPSDPSESPAPQPPGAFRVGLKSLRGKAARVPVRALRRLRYFSAVRGGAMIMSYMSFGTSRKLMVQGRVLRYMEFGPPVPDASALGNMVELYKRLGTDAVPGAHILARFGNAEQVVIADAGGYFRTELELSDPVGECGWHDVDLELIKPARAGVRIHSAAHVLIPPPTARFGVISDIDDTILWSNVTNKVKMLLMLAVSNAHTRKPFKGVTAFYNALRDGVSGSEDNPIFYVSSSPWHLYTPLVDFMKAQGIPVGPLMLKQLGVRTIFGSNRHHDHKLENIGRILNTYSHLPFILIGDSGQHDPEIYREVVDRYPGRIQAIYIRNVNPDPARIEALDKLIEDVGGTGVQLIVVPDSEFAAAHAAAEGLISPDSMKRVRVDKRDDERISNPKI